MVPATRPRTRLSALDVAGQQVARGAPGAEEAGVGRSRGTQSAIGPGASMTGATGSSASPNIDIGLGEKILPSFFKGAVTYLEETPTPAGDCSSLA